MSYLKSTESEEKDKRSFFLVILSCVFGFGTLCGLFGSAIVLWNIGVCALVIPLLMAVVILIAMVTVVPIIMEAHTKYMRWVKLNKLAKDLSYKRKRK